MTCGPMLGEAQPKASRAETNMLPVRSTGGEAQPKASRAETNNSPERSEG
jgi:hypothetical protein